MKLTIMDNMGQRYSRVNNRQGVELYISNTGHVITANPMAYHIPDRAVNGELVVAHGIEGISMECGKLKLATLDNHHIEDITGYKYINKKHGLRANNLKLVPKEESELDLVKDYLEVEGARKIFIQHGLSTGGTRNLTNLLTSLAFNPKEVIDGLANGGGYTIVNDITFSVNRYFKVQRPYLTREGILRIGQAGIYNAETDNHEFSAETLSALWEEATNLKKTDEEVYQLLAKKGSAVSDSFNIKFALNGTVHSIGPTETVTPTP